MSLKNKLSASGEDVVLDLFLRRRRLTVAEAATVLGSNAQSVEQSLDRLLERGVMLQKRGDYWELDKEPQVGASKEFVFTSDKKGQYRFGFCSDQHICSKYSRLDVLDDIYRKYKEQGIKTVFNGGNWIDGEARFNKHDLLVHGVDNQCDELARVFPKHRGIVTYAVAGDDHEGWYSQGMGIDIGSHAEGRMRKAGRKDWVNLGYMEAFITLRHRESGAESKLLIMHPGGGSSYALSYQGQKIIESFSGGEKPAAVLVAHYHKSGYFYVRNTHVILSACTQDQTPFMRKKRLEAHVGGGIMDFTQDPKTGALVGCKTEFWNYFVKGYYNGRWSHSGDTVDADRGV